LQKNLPNNFTIKSFSIPLFHEIAQGKKLKQFLPPKNAQKKKKLGKRKKSRKVLPEKLPQKARKNAVTITIPWQ